MVKVSSRWFSYHSYGTVMAIISLSFLLGDAASRAFVAWLIGRDLGWRAVSSWSHTTLFVLFVVNLVLLKEIRLPRNMWHSGTKSQRRQSAILQHRSGRSCCCGDGAQHQWMCHFHLGRMRKQMIVDPVASVGTIQGRGSFIQLSSSHRVAPTFPSW
jgi:hypothetical protein